MTIFIVFRKENLQNSILDFQSIVPAWLTLFNSLSKDNRQPHLGTEIP